MTPKQRFWAKVEKTETCWLWRGTTNGTGHGRFRVNNRLVQAHRFAYELFVGPIPEGLEIDHLCERPNCVNPLHLRVVDRVTHRARHTSKRTHCKHGHEYTPENTAYRTRPGIKGRQRVCRKCLTAAERRRRTQAVNV